MFKKATPIPFGTSTASVRGYRNLLYLHSKGLIADPRSPRLVAEVHLDNTFRATKKDNLQTRRAGFAAVQDVANGYFRKGGSSIPSKRKAERAALHNR
jgi:hypothetical protein